MIDNDMHASVQFKAEPVTSIIGAIDHTTLNRQQQQLVSFKSLHYYDEPYNFLTKMKMIVDIIIKKDLSPLQHNTPHTQDGSLVCDRGNLHHSHSPSSLSRQTYPSWLVLYWHYTTVLFWLTIKKTSPYYNQISNQQTTLFTSKELE